MHELSLDKVVSGGQTGVDRGALDAAIYLDLSHGGWCPRGRLAEDGVIPARYQLQETSAPQYAVRTEQNVIDSDATLILHSGPLSGGTKYTRAMAEKHQRPVQLVDLSDPVPTETVRQWLQAHGVRVLNVAGPRESSLPGASDAARTYLIELLSDLP